MKNVCEFLFYMSIYAAFIQKTESRYFPQLKSDKKTIEKIIASTDFYCLSLMERFAKFSKSKNFGNS